MCNLSPTEDSRLLNLERRQRAAEIEPEIATLAGHVNAIQYRFIKLLGEFDANDGWHGDGIKSFAHWLDYRCGIGQVEAREKVRVARALRDLPQIDAAFGSGEISYSKTRALTRAATPANEHQLLQIARYGTASHIEQVVRKYKRCKQYEEPRLDCGLPDRSFSITEDDDGTCDIRLRLPVEEGVLIHQAVEKMVDETRAGEANDPRPDSKNVSAETFLKSETRSYATSRAAALVQIAEHYLASSSDGARTLAPAERYQVLIHVNANDAHPDTQINGGHLCHHKSASQENRFVSHEKAAQIACSASITTVLENDAGDVLNIGRRSRVIPRAISHALAIRDQGCRFPGCSERKWIDAHHIKHWATGGETSLNNLVTLCRHHHRRLHKGDFAIATNDRELTFTNSRGETIEESLYPQFPSIDDNTKVVDSVMAEHSAMGLDINERTALTLWQGEVMDDSIVLHNLLLADGVLSR